MAGRRRSVASWLAGGVAILVLPAVAGVVLVLSPDREPDHASALVAELAQAGESADVIACVLRLAGPELELGPLGDEVEVELVAGCRQAHLSLALVDEGPAPEPADPGQPDTLGDDPFLDRLWSACEAGEGSACDELFTRAPPGSDYETFGLTCGQRADLLECAELGQPGEP